MLGIKSPKRERAKMEKFCSYFERKKLFFSFSNKYGWKIETSELSLMGKYFNDFFVKLFLKEQENYEMQIEGGRAKSVWISLRVVCISLGIFEMIP